MNSGIYKITCLNNKKFYIGSSNDIKRRWQEHKSYLRSGTHQNHYLQHCWDKYGEANFKFEVIEYVQENLLFDVEQSYMDKLKAYDNTIGFNQTKIAHSFGHDKLEKDYIVTLPSGKEILVKNLSKFCRENGIPSGGGLHQAARGETNQCHGFKARYAHQTLEEWKTSSQRSSKFGAGWKGEYDIIYPDGRKERIKSLNAFCIKNGLSQGSLRQVCIGLRKHHKGFKASFALK